MNVAIDAVGIRGHGGAAVLCELLHWLPHVRPDWRWHVFLFERDFREFDDPPISDRVTIEYTRHGDSGAARLAWVNSKLQKRVREIGADLILSVANIGARRPATPQVVLVHQINAFFNDGVTQGAFLNRLRMSFLRWQILAGAKASKVVIVQTEGMRDRMQQFEPSLAGRIQVIPSGYRTPPAVPSIRTDKRILIDKATRPRLIYVSHPPTHKNHLSLLKAWEIIHRNYPRASLLLTLKSEYYHNSKKKTQKYYDSFLKPILDYDKSMLKPNNIIWMGFLNADEVQYALANSDLMVFPSLAESFGLGLVEAMNAGCPIIASDLDYAHDVAGDAAVYFDPNDPFSIASAADKLLKSEENRYKLISLGREKLPQYSYENIANKITSIFDRIIKYD